MYGLPQGGILANKQLTEKLGKHGYRPVTHKIHLSEYKTRDLLFTLCVDGFGIKYKDKRDADHLFESLRKDHKIKVIWKGDIYFGINLKWDYVRDVLI